MQLLLQRRKEAVPVVSFFPPASGCPSFSPFLLTPLLVFPFSHPYLSVRACRVDPETGLPIYTIAQLKIGQGKGDTPLCPFDCDCCF